VDDNDSRIAALEKAVAALQATVENQARTIIGLQRNSVMALDPYVMVDETSDPRGPLVQLVGVNLQIINGEGKTSATNGLGNLIIGYDEINTVEAIKHCSNGKFDNQEECLDVTETWSHTHKTGSHYLVLGSENNYSQYGGMVAGLRNFATSGYSSVTGGQNNIACGGYSSVTGGQDNTASGYYSSIAGGQDNTSSGYYSSVTGGEGSTASGDHGSVTGGQSNLASGDYSSVSGGLIGKATGQHDWVAGSLEEDQ
jgi:hypothetical protein